MGITGKPHDALLEASGLFDRFIGKLRFADAAEDWSRCVSRLSSWEAEHLSAESPSSADSAEHLEMVEKLMHYGQMFAFIASYPEFRNNETSEMIQATQFLLKDKLRMWHGPKMSDDEADQILREVFPES